MKKRNILFNLLVFGILILGLHINANAQETSVPDGYTGIYNIADLSGIRNNPSGKYILMNDIDMTEDTKKGGDWDNGMGWTPIEEFSGVLDGNGHQIIGMNIYTDTDESAEETWNVGLIGLLNNGSIKNLGMKNVNIDVKARHVGALVGRIEFKNSPKTSVIKNCYISGDIRNTNGYNTYYSSGGIAGYIRANVYSDDTVIENCLNMANITVGTASADSYAGGILGNCWGADFDSKVCKNCYSIGKIKGAAYNGGITSSTCGNCFYLKGSMQFRTDSYQKLSLILIQSFTKGGREAAMLMEAEEREAFHKRIDRAKKEGEEASTRLLFPMILLLCQVMLLVMYPALTRFQGF